MKYLAVKIFWFFVNPIKKFYWFMVRPQTRGVKCLVENNGKLLLVKLNYAHHKWTFPGGGVGKKESFLDAAIRETKEEVNVDLNLNNLELVHASYRPKHDPTGDRVDFFFKAKQWSGEIKNMEPSKCDDLNWFYWNNLPENMTFHVREALECIRKGVFFNEIGINTLKEKGLYKL